MYLNGDGDAMATSPFYLKEDGDRTATSPFYLKGNAYHIYICTISIAMGWSPLHPIYYISSDETMW